MSFPRYPKYKDSGVEWLGEVPEHWQVQRLGFACNTIVPMRDKPERLDGAIPWIRIEDFDGKYISASKTAQGVSAETVANMNLKVLPIGAVLCSCSCSMGATAIVAKPLVTNQTFIGIVSGGAYVPEFLYYLFHAASPHLNSIGTGAIQTYLSRDDFRQLRLPLPSSSEQAAIAAFLDRETAKIDALIAEQQRLIELLQEKRQAVISHVVTKGLNPDAPMKDSGVEWLGEVPEHWEVVRLGHRGRLQNGLSIGGEAFGTGDPFVSYGDVYNNNTIPDPPSGLVRSSAQDQSKCSLETGDVLFTRTSETVDDIGVASTCLRSIPRSTFAGFLIRFRPYQGILDPGYSTYLFRNQGVQGHFAGTMNLVTRASLSQGELRNLPICIPPLEEQREIAAALDAQTDLLHCLVAEAERAITLLQERRSALISAAVTGQIDVRGLAGSEAA